MFMNPEPWAIYLLKKAAKKEWNQLRRKKFAVNKDEKRDGDLKSALTTNK